MILRRLPKQTTSMSHFLLNVIFFLIISFNGLSVISRSATGLTISKIALYLEIKTQIMLLFSIYFLEEMLSSLGKETLICGSKYKSCYP